MWRGPWRLAAARSYAVCQGRQDEGAAGWYVLVVVWQVGKHGAEPGDDRVRTDALMRVSGVHTSREVGAWEVCSGAAGRGQSKSGCLTIVGRGLFGVGRRAARPGAGSVAERAAGLGRTWMGEVVRKPAWFIQALLGTIGGRSGWLLGGRLFLLV